MTRMLRRRPDSVVPKADTSSFGGWDHLAGTTLAVCHPDWRGVRTAADAFGDPTVETRAADQDADEIVRGARGAGVVTLIVHGFPPGAETLLRSAAASGLRTRVVMHSSMAQHGAEAGEAEMMDSVVRLVREGVIGRLGFVKAGLIEAFGALDVDATHTPNRIPRLPTLTRADLSGRPPRIGVFGALFWRKNVVTQLGAVAILGGTAHVMSAPDVGYLDAMEIVEHGTLARHQFLEIQASTDLNLYVTLSECHPMGPLESYLAGVPALMSRTSDIFRDAPDLWRLTTVDEADDPTAIAAAARRLMDSGPDAVDMARSWMSTADVHAAAIWAEFTRHVP